MVNTVSTKGKTVGVAAIFAYVHVLFPFVVLCILTIRLYRSGTALFSDGIH
jgi:hypothetical protein